MFSDKELAYLRSQRLLRLATVEPNGQPDADAVGFVFDGQRFYIRGHNLPNSRKYKNIQAGHTQVSLIIDDLASVDPWTPRGIKIHGRAEIGKREGQPDDHIIVTPTVSWSWGIEDQPLFQHGKFTPRKIFWEK